VTFDEPTPEELALVHDSWVESFRKSPWGGCVRNDYWQTCQRATIQGILHRGTKLTVVLAPVVEGVHTGRRVMGWACTEPQLEVLHYLYVKADYRKHGIGRALLEHVAGKWHQPRYTHRTRSCDALFPRRWRWDPTPARIRGDRENDGKSQTVKSDDRPATA
jgi:GNAT superfamily N-acetyltransferase